MNMRTFLSLAVIAVTLSAPKPVIADETGVMPEVKTQNGISYLSGGIGSDQADAIKAAAKEYTLMVTCATTPSGEYLADVKVDIKDKSGSQVLETVTDGPFLLAQLAPGQYHVSAESDGRVVNKTIQVGAKHPAHVNLYWPDHAAQSSANDPM